MQKATGDYDEANASAVVFPLGGIGTGSIGLTGNGRLEEFSIANRPNLNCHQGFTFFALKVEARGQVKSAKIMNGDLPAPYSGEGREHFRGFGFGPPREALAGLPHFSQLRFRGRFPTAEISFIDQNRWADACMTALNPFIPHNADDSSLPCALFSFGISNVSREPIDVTLVGALQNPFAGSGANKVTRRQRTHQLVLNSADLTTDDSGYGELVLATDGSDVSAQEYWYRGDWFDNLERFWAEFCAPGRFPARTYASPRQVDSVYDAADVGMLCQHAHLDPGATATLRFAITWYFPWCVNYWNPGTAAAPPRWLNHYATRFAGAAAVADYVLAEWPRLIGDTEKFRDTLFDSTLPSSVLDRVSANLSVLKSPTVLRLTDGTLYGFEGCHADAGCCEGSCTHVWNYDQATPFLFPALARSMRRAAFEHGMQDSGRMAYRLLLPLARTRIESTDRAAADGQMGEVIKAYREWKVSGDQAWLAHLWPRVKQALAYSWDAANPDRWDRDKDGVMEGTQHHTLDVEWYGPNACLTGYYLAALAAAAEMADAMGEDGGPYRALAERGGRWVAEHLFNGEYYKQQVNLTDPSLPVDTELGQVKYQLGNGCHIDQVIGAWHARVAGLGAVLDPDQVRRALEAIYSNNFRVMRQHANVHRVFALNGERGVVIATWPHGGAPLVPVPYHGECMTGYEYQVASHMIYEGLVHEGLDIVEAISDRYDGRRRNPWNEIECGSHYARALSSYSLLLALSGFEFDLTRGYLGFYPRIHPGQFRSLWSVGSAWGRFLWDRGTVALEVLGGRLRLASFGCLAFRDRLPEMARVGDRAISLDGDPHAGVVRLEGPQIEDVFAPTTITFA